MATKETTQNGIDSQYDDPPDEPTLDDLFHILRNERRRYALFYLKQTDGEADISKLSEQVATWENDIAWEELTSKQRKRVYIALYQNHLPRMDEDGIINYDQDRGTITRDKHADAVEYYLAGPLSETPSLSADSTCPELQPAPDEPVEPETADTEGEDDGSLMQRLGLK